MAPHLPSPTNGDLSSSKHDEEKTITVLVTGFGPFQSQFPVNPSYEICKALPKVLPKSNTTDPTINIISHSSPIRVAYADAHALVPELLEAYAGTVDLVLHIGMASGRAFYTAEKYAHTRGYMKFKDVDGKFAPSPEPGSVADLPDLLTTSLEFDGLYNRWRESVAAVLEDQAGYQADVRVSENAGQYLCDYTYATSLAWYARRNACVTGGSATSRPVMFLHVPAESDEKTLETGGTVAQLLIRALAGCLLEKPKTDEPEAANGL